MAKSEIPIIGLIGGVGSGKSAVAAWLAEHVRAQIVDADVIGHAVLKRDDVKSQLRSAFGEGVFDGDQISRPRMAARVFGDSPEQNAARQVLEKIVHPVMRTEFEANFRTAKENSGIDLIVFDAAVLLDSGWSDAVDVIGYVDVPVEERLRRVAQSRGWSADELHRREESQLPLDQKLAAADIVIDNSESVETAGRQLEAYLRRTGYLPAISLHPLLPQTTLNEST